VRAAEAAGGIADMPEDGSGPALLRLLGVYGAAHPARFETLRTAIARIEAFAAGGIMRAEAARALQRLIDGFREWLGSAQRIAVDPEEGTEYRWEDVLTFEEGIDAVEEARLRKAIAETSVLREAIFLFTGRCWCGWPTSRPAASTSPSWGCGDGARSTAWSPIPDSRARTTSCSA